MTKNTNIIYLFKISKSKISGINLIGLMISSALGAFLLAVIVRVSFTISNNFQIIKATSELEASARMLNSFFSKVFMANGYNNNNFTTNINAIHIKSDPSKASLTLWYAGGINGISGIDGTLLCSGQPVAPSRTTPINTTIFFQKISASNLTDGYITCSNSPVLPTDSNFDASGYQPLVSHNQVADFYITAIVSDKNIPTNMANLNVTNASSTTYNAVGIKLALVLKSTNPVFNVDRTVVFQDIFNTKTFTYTDRFLYKLVIIQSPFIYTINPSDSSKNTLLTISN